MTATMSAPKKKPEKKRTLTVLLRLDGATADALAGYLASHEVPPKRNPVIVSAVRQLLAKHGHWPPKPRG